MQKNIQKEEVIILFKNEEVLNEKVITKSGGNVLQEYENIPAISAKLTEEVIENLKKNPDVLFFEEDKKFPYLKK